jgi:hypothetical protein
MVKYKAKNHPPIFLAQKIERATLYIVVLCPKLSCLPTRGYGQITTKVRKPHGKTTYWTLDLIRTLGRPIGPSI